MFRVSSASVALFISVAVALLLFQALLLEDRRGLLTVSFLDVGQGDAILIDAPSGRQMLIDGGRSSSVLHALGSVMPWYDRSIDVVVATHPDADHIGGLPDVLARYAARVIVRSSVQDGGSDEAALERAIASLHVRDISAVRGTVIDLGGGAYFEILSPDRMLPGAETNTACIVGRLVYGSTSFMLSCDAPQSIERYLVSLDGGGLRSDVLKAGHHGSKTSSDPLFVGFVDPQYAVYSRGCGNSYGHPNAETIGTFDRFDIPTKDTCEEGTVSFVSDGGHVRLK